MQADSSNFLFILLKKKKMMTKLTVKPRIAHRQCVTTWSDPLTILYFRFPASPWPHFPFHFNRHFMSTYCGPGVIPGEQKNA